MEERIESNPGLNGCIIAFSAWIWLNWKRITLTGCGNEVCAALLFCLEDVYTFSLTLFVNMSYLRP